MFSANMAFGVRSFATRIRTMISVSLACAAFAAAASVPGLEPARRDSLVELRVSYLMDTLRLKREDSGWVISPSNLPVEPVLLKRHVGLIFGLHAREKVAAPGRSEEALAAYNLNIEGARFVELRFREGKPVRLRLGFSPEEQATYWKLEEGREVYRVCNLAWAVPFETSEWMRRALYPDLRRIDDLRDIAVRWRDSAGQVRSYVLRRHPEGSGVWVFGADSDSARVPAAKQEMFVQGLLMVADGIPSGPVRPSPDPGITVSLTGRDGVVRVLRAEGVEGNRYVVRYPGTNAHALLARGRLDVFRRTAEELRTGPALGPRTDDGTGRPPSTFPGFGVLLPKEHEHKDDEDPGFVDTDVCVEGGAPAREPADGKKDEGGHEGHAH